MLKEGYRCLTQVYSVYQTPAWNNPNLCHILPASRYRTTYIRKAQLRRGTDLNWQNKGSPSLKVNRTGKGNWIFISFSNLAFISQDLLVTNLLKLLTLRKHLLPSSSLTSWRDYMPKEGINAAFCFCQILHSIWHSAEHQGTSEKVC